MEKIGLFCRTAIHIPLQQLVSYFLRRIIAFPALKLTKGFVRGVDEFVVTLPHLTGAPMAPVSEKVTGERFLFIGQSSTFSIYDIDWHPSNRSRLWRYNLHYFDWLADPNVDMGWKNTTISRWIEENPVGVCDAWEPYTASLRIVNWIKYFCYLNDKNLEVDTTWLDCLKRQADWLSAHMEFHIRANHLFKNIVAQIFAFGIFSDGKSEKQLNYYLSLLNDELSEQFHSDGGHYERCPSYHSIMIEDCIDLFNFIKSQGIEHSCMGRLVSIIENGLTFVKDISFADGLVSLIGDSTLRGAHSHADLQSYWERVSRLESNKTAVFGISLYEESGFCIFQNQNYKVVISAGEPSPSYQPGHTHCDIGGFELFSNKMGKRILVDSGVCQYAAGPMRQYVRSSAAHNVLTVNGQDQHEMWGEFRIAGRMEVTSLNILKINGVDALTISMKAHSATAVQYLHYRTFIFTNDALVIRDRVECIKGVRVDMRFHIHPDLDVAMKNDLIVIEHDNTIMGGIRSASGLIPVVEDAWYCPDFGEVHASKAIRFYTLLESNFEFDTFICVL